MSESRPSREASALQPPRGASVAARDLTRRFGAHVALDRVSLSIRPGQAYGLLGANGAGKTTFIRMVTGYLLPSEGSVEVDGVPVATRPLAARRRIGFVMETSRLYPELRVRGFLRFVAGAHRLSGASRDRAVDRVIERFELRRVEKRPIGNLSKGFQQRVSLAQAFLHEPPLVIVDEPTGGLDPVQRGEVQGVLEKLRGERTLLLCTHDLHEARRLTERVAVLNSGRLVAEGETEAVLGSEDVLALFRAEPEAAS